MPREKFYPSQSRTPESRHMSVSWARGDASMGDVGITVHYDREFEFLDTGRDPADGPYDCLSIYLDSREQVNGLIRSLRKARDQVYGVDA